MSLRDRIAACLMLEQMRKNKKYCKKMGLIDASVFDGKRVNDWKNDEKTVLIAGGKG